MANEITKPQVIYVSDSIKQDVAREKKDSGFDSFRSTAAAMENYGKTGGDYLQIEKPFFESLKQNNYIGKDVSLNDYITKDRSVLDQEKYDNELGRAAFSYMSDKMGAQTPEEAALYIYRPSFINQYGRIDNIPESEVGSAGKTARQVMQERVKNAQDRGIATEAMLRRDKFVSNLDAQRVLKDQGLYDGPLDGIIGEKSQKAIRDYQSKNELSSDGILGPKTRGSIFDTVASKIDDFFTPSAEAAEDIEAEKPRADAVPQGDPSNYRAAQQNILTGAKDYFKSIAMPFLPDKTNRKQEIVDKFKDKYVEKYPKFENVTFEQIQEAAQKDPATLGEFLYKEKQTVQDFKIKHPKYANLDDRDVFKVLSKSYPGKYENPAKTMSERIKYALADQLDSMKGGDLADEFLRSLGEGWLQFAADMAKSPELYKEYANTGYNAYFGSLGFPEARMSGDWSKNPVATYLDQKAKSISYLREEYADDDLVSLMEEGDAGRVANYIVHQFFVNSPNTIIAIAGTFAGPAGRVVSDVSMFTPAAVQAMEQAREAGVSSEAELAHATLSGAAEVFFEKGFGTQSLLRNMGSQLTKRYGKEAAQKVMKVVGFVFLNSIIGEGTSEGLTNIAQDLSAFATGADPNFTVKGMLRRAFEAGVIGGFTGGVMTGPTALHQVAMKKAKQMSDDITDAQQAIDNINNGEQPIANKALEKNAFIDDTGNPYGEEEVLNLKASTLGDFMQEKFDKFKNEVYNPSVSRIEELENKIKEVGNGEGSVDFKTEAQNEIDDIEQEIRMAREMLDNDMRNSMADIERMAIQRARDEGVNPGDTMEAWDGFVADVMTEIDSEKGNETDRNVGDVIRTVIQKYKFKPGVREEVSEYGDPIMQEARKYATAEEYVASKSVEEAEMERSFDEGSYPMANRGEWYGEGNYKAEGGRLVEMTPQEFLSKAKPLEIDEDARENIDELKQHIKSGKTLDPLTIYKTDTTDVKASDGRHRAIAAEELGIETVPVVDYTTKQQLTDEWNKAQQGPIVSDNLSMYRTSKEAKMQAPTFYSSLERIVQNLPQEKGTAEQFLNQIKKQPGFKAEEIEWTGLEEWFADRKDVTKQEIVDFLENNKVEVKTVEKGETTIPTANDIVWKQTTSEQGLKVFKGELEGRKFLIEEEDDGGYYVAHVDGMLGHSVGTYTAAVEAINEYFRTLNKDVGTKFASYQLPGGENYREVLITLPVDKPTGDINIVGTEAMDKGFLVKLSTGEELAYSNAETEEDARTYATERIQDYPELLKKPPVGLPYKGSHFEEPNILVHLRMNDRMIDGKKVLFLEEIQSDWHQQGRKKGYRQVSGMTREEMSDRVTEIEEKGQEATSEERREWANLKSELEGKGVPNAPFKKTWETLAIKKAMQIATAEGYDSIAWTPGEVQIERYINALTQNVDELRITETEAGDRYLFALKNGQKLLDKEITSDEQVAEYVGKAVADKLLSQESAKDENGIGRKALSGKDLRVRDTWPIEFYDKKIKKLFKKVAGKLDKSAEIEMITIPQQKQEYIGVVSAESAYDNDEAVYVQHDDGSESLIENRADIRRLDAAQDARFFVEGEGIKKSDIEAMSMPITDKMKGEVQQGLPIMETKEEYQSKQLDIAFDAEDIKPYVNTKEDIDEVNYAHGSLEQYQNEIQNMFARFYNEGSEPYVAAKNMHNALKKRGFIDTRGIPIATAQDAAEVASLFRNPRMEILQFILIKGGKVVSHLAHTSNVPYGVMEEDGFDRAKKVADKIGADGVYIAHNHPSGNPTPSDPDRFSTRNFASQIGDKFKGHIVMNGGEFSIIGSNGSFSTMPYSTEKVDYYRKSLSFNAPEEVAKSVKENAQGDGDTVIFRNAKGETLSIDYINKGRNYAKYIYDSMRRYGASSYVFASANKTDKDIDWSNMPEGMADFLSFSKGRYDGPWNSLHDRGYARTAAQMSNIPVYPGGNVLIQEEQVGYGEEDLDRTDQEAKEFGGYWEEYMRVKKEKAKQIKQAEKQRKMDEIDQYVQDQIDSVAQDNYSEAMDAEIKLVRYEAVREFVDQVMENGGIKPYENAYLKEEFDENVPVGIRRKEGALAPDEMASVLSNNYGYDFANDTDMYEYMRSIGIGDGIDSFKKDMEGSIAALKDIMKKARSMAESNARIMRAMNRILDGKLDKPIKTVIRENTTGKMANEDGKNLKFELKRLEQETANAYREGRKEEAQRLTKKYMEMRQKERENRKLRQEFKKHMNRIMSVKTDKMPDKYASEIKDIQSVIDPSVPNNKTIKRLEATREFIKENPNVDIPDYVLDDLKRLEKKNRANMTIEELASLADTVQHLAHLNKTENDMIVGQRKLKQQLVSKQAVKELKPEGEIKQNFASKFLEDKGLYDVADRVDKIVDGAKNMLFTAQMHWDTLLEMIAGKDSMAYNVIFEQVKQGKTVERETAEKYRDFFLDRLTSAVDRLKNEGVLGSDINDLEAWRKKKIKVNGVSRDFTNGERISIYLHSQNSENMRHLENGYSVRKEKNRVYKWRNGELQTLLESITPVEKEVAKIQWALSDMTYNDLNEVFMQKNRYSIPKVNKYFGIKIAHGEKQGKIEEREQLEALKRTNIRPGLAKGFLEGRRGASQAIMVYDYFNQLSQQINSASAYVGLEIPLTNASKLMFDPEWSSAIKNRYSEDFYSHIEQGLRDVVGVNLDVDKMNDGFFEFKNLLTAKAFALNVGVMIKQTLSLPFYNVYVPMPYLVQAVGDINRPGGLKKAEEALSALSVEYRQRQKRGFQQELNERYLSRQSSLMAGKARTFEDIAMGGIGMMDKWTVTMGMIAAYNQKMAELKDSNLSVEEKMNQSIKYAEWVTNRTQPTFAKEHMSSMQRSRNFFIRTVASFGTATNQMYNMVARTYAEAKRNPSKENQVAAAKAAFYVGILNPAGVILINKVMRSLFNPNFDPEKELKPGALLLDWIDALSGTVFIARDAFKAATTAMRGQYFFSNSSAYYSILEDSGKALANMFKGVKEGDGKKLTKGIVGTVDPLITYLFRTPGLQRTYDGIGNFIEKYG